MDFMGVDPRIALEILRDELGNYRATRFRFTTRLRILNRVDAEPTQRQALEKELIGLEAVIAEYEASILSLETQLK